MSEVSRHFDEDVDRHRRLRERAEGVVHHGRKFGVATRVRRCQSSTFPPRCPVCDRMPGLPNEHFGLKNVQCHRGKQRVRSELGRAR
jgi:hypothetical protein